MEAPTATFGHVRLSGQDASFLSFEQPGRPMHIGALAFVSTEGWLDGEGRLDSDRLRTVLAERASRIPGLDRTLARAPLSGWPLWMSNPDLDWDLQIQVGDAASSESEIRALAETAMATHMDRARPLWRVLIIPGHAGTGRFALVFLAHHALVDGIAGIDLLAGLLDRRDSPHAPAVREPRPSQRQLAAYEVTRWLAAPGCILSSAAKATYSAPHRSRLLRRGLALLRTSVRLLSPGPTTRLRGANEGTRTVAWFSVPDRPLRMARRRLGGTPNDLLLAAVANAIHEMPGGKGRRHLRKLRAAVPVSFRTRAQRYNLGNRIGLELLPLDPKGGNLARSVAGISHHSALQKRRGDPEGYEVLGELTTWTGQWSQRLIHWLAGTMHSYAILVTNVPGPSRVYRLGGAPVLEIFPLVPLFGSQSLSVAVVRYGGNLRVGLTSSWAEPAMVEAFSRSLQAAFDRIVRDVAEPDPDALPAAARIPLPREI